MRTAYQINKRTKLTALAAALAAAGGALAAPGVLQSVASTPSALESELRAAGSSLESSVQFPQVSLPHPALPSAPDTLVMSLCGETADLSAMAVYAQTNLYPANQVIAYARAEDGSLCEAGRFATGGASDTSGIVNSGQDGLITGADPWLFVVNSGSASDTVGDGSLSVFRVEPDRLVLTSVMSTSGPNPRSVTRHGDLIYVVNAGLNGQMYGTSISDIPETVQGFRFDTQSGQLKPLAGGHARTVDAKGDPAQIGFSTDGDYLVVTQRRSSADLDAATGIVEIFPVNADGSVSAPRQYAAGGNGTFGFRFDEQNNFYVVHGNLQVPDRGGVSSHRLDSGGTAHTVTPHSVDQASDTCWNAISRKTEVPYFYTSSFFDSTIAQWKVNADGALELVNAVAASSAASGGTNYFFDSGGLDMVITRAGEAEYLYVLNNPVPPPVGMGTARIVGYQVMPTGDLTQLGHSVATSLPSSSFGLAAW